MRTLDLATVGVCESCGVARVIDEGGLTPHFIHEGDESPTLFCAVACDSPSGIEACRNCGELDYEENLTNGGEYDPSAYYCHDCRLDVYTDKAQKWEDYAEDERTGN